MLTLFNAFLSALWPIINSKRFKLLVIGLMDRYAKTTGNDVDDMIVDTIRGALLPDRV